MLVIYSIDFYRVILMVWSFQAQMRAMKAEERNRKLAVEHENRVLKLEQKLVQFSDLASNYDRHRQEDQQTIIKLKVGNTFYDETRRKPYVKSFDFPESLDAARAWKQ